jgi:hypothetical protein
MNHPTVRQIQAVSRRIPGSPARHCGVVFHYWNGVYRLWDFSPQGIVERNWTGFLAGEPDGRDDYIVPEACIGLAIARLDHALAYRQDWQYNAITKNCESFATFVTRGQDLSVQSVVGVLGTVVVLGLLLTAD